MWKAVDGYDGFYEVNESGDVRGVERTVVRSDGIEHTIHTKVLTPIRDSDGYMNVKLSKNGTSVSMKVHRIVAKAFVPGYWDGAEVNHIDCNRANNTCGNLEWVTHRENVQYTKSLKRHVSDKDLNGNNNPNYGNHKLHDRFVDEPGLSKIQSRPGAKNGRARPIRARFPDGDTKDFNYIGECSRYLIDNSYIPSSNIDNVSTQLRIAAENGGQYYGIYTELI